MDNSKTKPLICEEYNCRGFNDDKKRGEAFHWLKTERKEADLIILADTKCHRPEDKETWSKEWSDDENDSIWSLGEGGSRGVTILITPKFKKRDAEIIDTKVDDDGRYVKIIICIAGSLYRILGLYAPKKKRQQIRFFTKLLEVINDNFDAENIVGGDYNCTFNNFLDRINCVGKNNDPGRKDLINLMRTYDLEDIYRRRNPAKRQYTWFGPEGKASRLDFWLTSVSLNAQVEKVDSHYAPFTDHHGTTLTLRTHEIKTGKGIWKMNSSQISKPEYRVVFEQFWGEWQEKKQDFSDISIWWDIGKTKIKNLTRNFCIEQNFAEQSKLINLEREITRLQNSMSDPEKLLELQERHNIILSERAAGAKIRSRLQWWEEGEKSSKFFHNLEKRNAKNKAWDKILDEKGKLIYGTKNVQDRQVRFYKDLFTSQKVNPDHSYFLGKKISQLSKKSKENLEKEIKKEEIFKAIKKMPGNKSPGQDGLIIEFYRLFWDLIGDDLLEVYLSGLNKKELSYSQYLSLIVLLYKQGPRENLKNWRPISLLNVDYKILSKVLAERLILVLPEIIHTDQKGCMKGRFIGENIRLIEDLLSHIENLDEEAIIFLQDQFKAFDRVEWAWLFSTMRHFNFGDTFIGWLNTFYKKAKSSVITNGYQSQYFDITRGIRQGDSLSALLYIIQIEPLAEKIRQERSLEGIKVKLTNMNGKEIHAKGCQYVDDCNSFLKNKTYIPKLVEILEKYESVSGSLINFDKTKALNISQKREEKINEIELTPGPEKALGVPVGGRDKENNNLWGKLIDKMQTTLNIWRSRDLSLTGKTHIIRSVGVSKLLYALEMKTIEDKHIKEINEIIWKFLWSGKNPRFSKSICFQPRRLGGLNLVDINIIKKVKRISWVIRVLKDESEQHWSLLIENYFKCLDKKFGIDLFSLKITEATDLVNGSDIPKFYKECLIYFQELIKISRINISEELLWCNHRFRFNNKPISLSHWSRDGITRASQLYTNGALDPVNILQQLTHKAGFIFEFQTIRKVFPLESRAAIFQGNGLENANKNDILNFLMKVPGKESKLLKDLTSKEMYEIFLNHEKPEIMAKGYWGNHAFPGHDFNWEEWSKNNFTNGLMPRKCLDHNFKLYHGYLSTESRLRRMRYSNGNCVTCFKNGVTAYESVQHMYMECGFRPKIWKLLEKAIQKVIGPHFIISRLEILAGFFNGNFNENERQIVNVLITMCRYQIWLNRNAAKYQSKFLTFGESYLKLKYYICNHIETLQLSKSTKPDMMPLLENLFEAIQTTFRSGIEEHNL